MVPHTFSLGGPRNFTSGKLWCRPPQRPCGYCHRGPTRFHHKWWVSHTWAQHLKGSARGQSCCDHSIFTAAGKYDRGSSGHLISPQTSGASTILRHPNGALFANFFGTPPRRCVAETTPRIWGDNTHLIAGDTHLKRRRHQQGHPTLGKERPTPLILLSAPQRGGNRRKKRPKA